MTLNHGFRIVGSCAEERRAVNWPAAFAAYTALDERAEVNREGYLSAFTFGDDFRHYLDATGSTKGFSGACCAPWLWFDFDREDNLDAARRDCCRLALSLVERYRIDDDALLLFFSGSKGFHAGLPTALWTPTPSTTFHTVARRFAETLAAAVEVRIDSGVYDRVRAFRAPNSRHSKTGRHKRRFTLDELTGLSIGSILDRSKEPAPFDLPTPPPPNAKALDDWRAAADLVERETTAKAQRRAAPAGGATLNRSTLEFLREGAGTGDRHRLLFAAAANLAEFGCPPPLAHALLIEAALDTGLPPAEVRRQIDCGLAHARGGAS